MSIRWGQPSKLKLLVVLISVALMVSVSHALPKEPDDRKICKTLLVSPTRIDPAIIKELSSLYLTLFVDGEQNAVTQDRPRNNAIWKNQIRKTAFEIGVDQSVLTEAVSLAVNRNIDQYARDKQQITRTTDRIRNQQQNLARNSICERNEAVVRAIEYSLGFHCEDITVDSLSQIQILEIIDINGALNPNDLHGLTGLLHLHLVDNPGLKSLPLGIFDQLRNLTFLSLNSNPGLTSLPLGIFDQLVRLKYIGLSMNPSLTSLPLGIFDKLESLEELALDRNPSLTVLPIGVSHKLNSLNRLTLTNNPGLTQSTKWIIDQPFNLNTIRILKIRWLQRKVFRKTIEELKKRGVDVYL